MHDEKHVPERCAPNDPRRCQSTSRAGQCVFRAIPDSNFCVMHAARSTQKTNPVSQQHSLYQFRRTEVQKRIAQFRQHDASLAEELGLLRLLLEEVVNKCQDSTDLLIATPQISALAGQIQALQHNSIKIQEKTGNLLGIEQVTAFAQALYAAVTEFVNDPDTLERIATAFEILIEDMGQPTPQQVPTRGRQYE